MSSKNNHNHALVHAVLVAVDARQSSVFDLEIKGFSGPDAWACARWLIDQDALAGNYGLSDTGSITYLHIHRLTQKGRILLEQLKRQLARD